MWKMLTLGRIFCVFFMMAAHDVCIRATYFSMGDLKLTIPSFVNEDNRILTHLYTLPQYTPTANDGNKNNLENDINKAAHRDARIGINKTLKYVLQGNENHFEIVDNNLAFTEAFLHARHQFKELSNISVGISVEDSSGHHDKTTFSVGFMPGGSLQPQGKHVSVECDFLVTDLCYWQSAEYRIYENRPPSIVGTLSSPYLHSLCPGYSINYTMQAADDRVELVPPEEKPSKEHNPKQKEDKFVWRLRTRKPLERDVHREAVREFNLKNRKFAGEYVNFTIICHIVDAKHTRREVPKAFAIRVIDENDNPPKRQEFQDIFIKYDHPLIKQTNVAVAKFMLTDRDSLEVNNHQVEFLNDTHQIFKVKCVPFIDDRYGERQTVQHCELFFARQVNLDDIKINNYTVLLQMNDTAMLPGHGSSYAHVAIHLTHHADPRLEVAPKDLPPLKLYPRRENHVFRLAGPLARVTNPHLPLAANICNFTLIARDPSYLRTFSVTKDDGIIFVRNITSLRKSVSSVRLEVQWEKDGKYQSDHLIIDVKDEPISTCVQLNDNKHDWTHCAKFSNPDDCMAACAIGTGGSGSVEATKKGTPVRCQWRGNRTRTNLDVSTDFYQTCTPDKSTCPDGICDSLEKSNRVLCPQDCTRNTVVPTKLNPKTLMGITRAIGVCICSSSAQCICGEKIGKKSKIRKEAAAGKTGETSNETTDAIIPEVVSNLSRHTGLEVASCGTGCLLGILAVAVFLLATIASIVACWRLDKVQKVRGKFTGEHNDLSAPLSDYVDRGLLPENAITLNFDMTTSLAHSNKVAPDPKWEFPRNQLIIEQTLGEGEFGRVLRARAKDIGGHSGYTIVAVKTLKDDARDAELTDLLSEYQLLKEVSHPNIIKLLGASTLPGGPVYLIIEYAQYGSLRSYLRRSRHLKSETQLPRVVPCLVDEVLPSPPRSDHYDEPKTCKVTPKDILSFAWQIANGMSYLSDIKLVHRDLAARNVLLSDEKVCKISDFGLTRDIYEEDAYFKRSKGRVPVKWMAPESLSDHVYTSKSDVWSYGILIWELVTLGATPYPGIQVQNLFHLLKSGYRMERPENCSVPLYKIMKSCWHVDAEQRPTFHDLSTKFEKMLEDQVEYLDLTANAIHNRSYFCTLNDDVPNREDEDDEDEDETGRSEEQQLELETNLEKNSPRGKFRNNERLVEEKINNLLENNNELKPDLSPGKGQHGYETPVKTRYANTGNVTANPVQYYTNMDAKPNLIT